MPRSQSHSRIQSAEYPLSPASFCGCSGHAVASSTSGSNRCVSCSWPGPTATASGVPWPSQIRCNFVPKPPWLRPRAWSAGSPAGRFFFRGPRRRLVGPNHRAIDGKQLPVDLPAVDLAGLQVPQDAVPQAPPRPVAKAVIDRLPGAETLREVAPAAAVGQRPEDAVDHQAVVLPLAAPPPVFGQQVLDLVPLLVGELVAGRSDRHLALLGWLARSCLPPSTKPPSNSPDRT